MTDRQSTHAPGCWGWGPRHYECALREIELLVAEWKRVTAAQGEAKARAELLAEALREVMLWIENWSPPFTEDNEWPDTEAKAQAALAQQPAAVDEARSVSSIMDGAVSFVEALAAQLGGRADG